LGTALKTSDFAYKLPPELIAQRPTPGRDESRLLVVDRKTGSLTEHLFSDIVAFFSAGDVVVINNSKVIPARLFGRKASGAQIEIFLLKKTQDEMWEALLKPAKRVQVGSTIALPAAGKLEILARCDEKRWLVRFSLTMPLLDFLEAYGQTPLPPYISRPQGASAQNPQNPTDVMTDVMDDKERYQTVYAQKAGSVAAPTAGLHFSKATLAALVREGVVLAPLTLHIGYGTFAPITSEEIEAHHMEAEQFELPPETALIVNSSKRVIAVGSTACRVLESTSGSKGVVMPQTGVTDLFIKPGYRFQVVDCLLTNFHLPRSTLFILVCAFAGRDLMFEAYRYAIAAKFRFYSYGDCMLII